MTESLFLLAVWTVVGILALVVMIFEPPVRSYLCWGCGVLCAAERCRVCRDEHETTVERGCRALPVRKN